MYRIIDLLSLFNSKPFSCPFSIKTLTLFKIKRDACDEIGNEIVLMLKSTVLCKIYEVYNY